MADNKYIEFLDPVSSFPLQASRIPLARPGRYLGFDTWIDDPNGGGDIPIRVCHGSGSKFISGAKEFSTDENSLRAFGTLITPHGVVFNKHIEDPLIDGIPLSFLANSSSDPQFYVFYATYSWVKASGGSQVNFGTYAFSPSNPDDPDPYEGIASPEVEVPLGYFKVDPGATNSQGLHYYPCKTPKFGWSDEDYFDRTLYAKLKEYNIFENSNHWSIVQVNHNNIIGGYILELPQQGDFYRCDFSQVSGNPYIQILQGQSGVAGQIFHLYIEKGIPGLGGIYIEEKDSGGTLITPESFKTSIPDTQYLGLFLTEGSIAKIIKLGVDNLYLLLDIFPLSKPGSGWIDMQPRVLSGYGPQIEFLEYWLSPDQSFCFIRCQIKQTYKTLVTGTWTNIATVNLPFVYSPDQSRVLVREGYQIVGTEHPRELPFLMVNKDNQLDLFIQDLPQGTYLFSDFAMVKG